MINENFLESCCQDKLIARREAIMGEVAKMNQKEEEEIPTHPLCDPTLSSEG